jgi:hypothetical protein
MNVFEWIAEQRIREAIDRGEFDNLPGKGKPLNLDDDLEVPEDLRMTYRILKRAGIPPLEVSLRKELERLKEELACAKTDEQRKSLEHEIRMTCLRLVLLKKDR